MVKREQPKYVYKRILKSQAEEQGLEYALTNEIDNITNEWNSKYQDSINETIKLYSTDFSDIQTHVIKVSSNKLAINPEGELIYKYHKRTAQYRIRKPHQFIELELTFIPNNSNQLSFIEFNEDIELLNSDKNQFQKIENSGRIVKYLVVREQIQNLIHEIWDALNLQGCEIKIENKRLHFIDSTPGIVHEAVYQITSEILNISIDFIKKSVLEKFKSFEYFFETMNYEYIEYYQSSKRTTYNGLRLVSSDDFKDPFASLKSIFLADSEIELELKNIFKKYSSPKSVTKCAPVYHDALVYKNKKGRIEGTFNICFDSNSIENNHRILMDTNTELINNLRKIIQADTK